MYTTCYENPIVMKKNYRIIKKTFTINNYCVNDNKSDAMNLLI